jgi:hypothetical protein
MAFAAPIVDKPPKAKTTKHIVRIADSTDA